MNLEVNRLSTKKELLNSSDIGTLCVCAERYAMGRHTYMPSLVCEIIAKAIPLLSEKDLVVLQRDIVSTSTEALSTDGAKGECWQKLRNAIAERIEKCEKN